MRAWASVFILSCLLLLPLGALAQGAATAEDQEARKEFQLGRESFDTGNYETALQHFERAYDLSPRPQLLYNIAKTEDHLGQKRDARDHYKRFLAAVPDAPNRGQVERRVSELEIEIAREPAPIATPREAAERAAATGPSQASPLAPAAPQKSERIRKKWWFWTAVGAAVAAGAAVGVIAGTRGGDGAAEGPLTYNDMTRVREL